VALRRPRRDSRALVRRARTTLRSSWAAEDGEEWVAAFDWGGAPAELDGGELTVGPNVSVELLAQGSKAKDRPQRARRSRASVLEGELAEARREVERLTRKLRRENESHLADITRRDTEYGEGSSRWFRGTGARLRDPPAAVALTVCGARRSP